MQIKSAAIAIVAVGFAGGVVGYHLRDGDASALAE